MRRLLFSFIWEMRLLPRDRISVDVVAKIETIDLIIEYIACENFDKICVIHAKIQFNKL